ncbi:TetR/AcrR family transcriptional regulator [Marinomonas pollencensis]|uniref:TetR family transcriptional regulator n=1 Tax=Marinomonas pollencensis TaxID=491954 RepID=A0A3E0DT88_9GAMM|nr:TetR/AcrR family transcriptional regulator [Marinomonas pollencensis]REG86700.1 TetR family transcriptional regulator [Marinomonas pollencensis]
MPNKSSKNTVMPDDGQKQDLAPRNEPVQSRSIRRSKQIIDVTGELLERVGLDDLNTIIIAKEVGISIGSLYHYFPNKYAILYAMGSRWLESIDAVFMEVLRWPLEELALSELIDKILAIHLKTYKKQKAILTLVQAMFSVKELRELDAQHDDLVIRQMSEVFKRIGLQRHIRERERIARLYLEVTHSTFLVVVNQNENRAKRTLNDLKRMIESLLAHHLSNSQER